MSRLAGTVATVVLTTGLCSLAGTPRVSAGADAPPRTPATQAASPAASTQPADGRERQVVNVATAEEFVKAIGPDRVIKLAPGEYVLTDVKDRWMEFVRWDRKFDGLTLMIRNVRNLSIVGTGHKPVRLIVRPMYVFVLGFDRCEGVELVNLTLGHAPDRGACDCGVVGAFDCAGLTFRNCDLFGCGTEGLTLQNVRGLWFEESTIRDCTAGILTATGCRDLSFTRSRFVGNMAASGFVFHDTRDALFTECAVERNVAGSLFEVTSSSNIRFDRGEIRGNRAERVTERADDVTFRGTTVENEKAPAD